MIEITLPEILDYLDTDLDVTAEMLDSLFYRITFDLGATSMVFWLDKFSDHKQGNRMVLRLVEEGIITTSVQHNYAEIELNRSWLVAEYTQEGLESLILENKLNKYLSIQSNQKKEGKTNQVKSVSGIKETGLVRKGFAEAGHHHFKYDISMLKKYKTEIIKFSIKSMEKMETKLHRSLRIPAGYDYGSIIEKSIDVIIENPEWEFILGELLLDSRGRAIYECLKKVFNPIANKMARALVVAPPELVTVESLDNAYLCIAELYHGFIPDIQEKVAKGKKCYESRAYHNLDLTTEEGLDDMYENIWLERLYKDIEMVKARRLHRVTTPLEVDFSASNMTMIGLLLNHSEYVDDSKYMWEVEGLTKLQVKTAQTPYVFGSSASIKSLWAKNDLEYTAEQIDIMRDEQTKGKFAIANEFKDIIIKHCNPTALMNFHINDEKFQVECNKTKNVGDTTKSYVVLDSATKSFKIIAHTNTHKVPDLKQFVRYPVTGLIHNRDSWLLDFICQDMKWILPIHDAGIVTWAGATTMRNKAVEGMHKIRDTRESTVYNYLKSINIDRAGMVKYAKLLSKVAKLNEGKTLRITPYLLK